MDCDHDLGFEEKHHDLDSRVPFFPIDAESMDRPQVAHQVYAVPRGGGEAGEYEDAATIRVDAWPVCAAVADGATESVFAQQWARALVHGITNACATTAGAFIDTIPGLRREWHASVAEAPGQQPWYLTAKMADGAYATALGLSLHSDGTWRAVSVGDCCLFHVRERTVRQSWPYEAPDAFTNRPTLLSSRSDRSVPQPETKTGTWAANDAFLLATDAVASWLLKRTPGAWEGIPESFQQKVSAAREEGVLRNDDATLLVLEIEGTPLPNASESTGE